MTKNFYISNSGHPVIQARVNGIEARFIIDTGAGNSCIDTEHDKFGIKCFESDNGIIGAGNTSEISMICEPATFSIRTHQQQVMFVVLDLFNINHALIRYGDKPVDGVIGSDILIKGRALIDYENNILTLK